MSKFLPGMIEVAPSIQHIDIDPDFAASLLSTLDARQRLQRPTHVRFLAREMAAGNWHGTTNDLIVISKSGTLINGQHRMAAVVASGVTSKFWVMYDAPDESYDVMDQGSAPRSMADYIRGTGAMYSCTIATICRILLPIDKKNVAIGSRPSTADIQWYLDNEYDRLITAARLSEGIREVCSSKGALAAGIVICLRHDATKAAEFFDMVSPSYALGLDAGHPARTLRETLITERLKKRYLGKDGHMKAAIKAYSAWVECKKLFVIKLDDAIPTTPKIAEQAK
jgi:hypothetical protein